MSSKFNWGQGSAVRHQMAARRPTKSRIPCRAPSGPDPPDHPWLAIRGGVMPLGQTTRPPPLRHPAGVLGVDVIGVRRPGTIRCATVHWSSAKLFKRTAVPPGGWTLGPDHDYAPRSIPAKPGRVRTPWPSRREPQPNSTSQLGFYQNRSARHRPARQGRSAPRRSPTPGRGYPPHCQASQPGS